MLAASGDLGDPLLLLPSRDDAKSDHCAPRRLSLFCGRAVLLVGAGHPKAAETSDDGAGSKLSNEAMEDGLGETVVAVSNSFPGSMGSKLGLKWLNPDLRLLVLSVLSNCRLDRPPCRNSKFVVQLPCDPLRRLVPIGSSPGG